ncbi:hypothetical protein ACTXT7_000709 [Hymenolepis weldensis]
MSRPKEKSKESCVLVQAACEQGRERRENFALSSSCLAVFSPPHPTPPRTLGNCLVKHVIYKLPKTFAATAAILANTPRLRLPSNPPPLRTGGVPSA